MIADLEVPAGVTLRGSGPSTSVVRAASTVAVRLSTGASGVTRLEALTVMSDACAGVVIDGSGEAVVDRVRVEVGRGIGLGVEAVSRVTLSDVDVIGPVADGSAPSAIPLPPYRCATSDPATHGIVLARVVDAELTRVTSRGFVGFGALFVESTVTWSGGASSDHVGVGLEVYGGSVTLTDVELCGARQDAAPIESFNGVFLGGAEVSSVRLRVCDGQVFGLFHDRATATHSELSVIDHGFAGVWAQDAPMLELRGATLRGNAFAGVAAFRVGALVMSDALVEATTEGLITMGSGGAVRAADGVHVVDTPSSILTRVTLLENARVGLLHDLAGRTTADIVVREVRVSGTGTSLGAIVQNGTVTAGWDSGVVRDGVTRANDLAFTGTLPIAGAVGPSCLPVIDGVVSGGLSTLVP